MDITPFGGLADLASTIINKFFPDKAQEEKDQLALQMQVMLQEAQLAKNQSDTNTAEAANPNVFVSGWRPFVGWVCGTAFGVQFVIGPLGTWIAALAGHPINFPPMDIGTMMPLLLGMLGLGGMRTVEKLQNAQGNH
jgi:hypothetical protein